MLSLKAIQNNVYVHHVIISQFFAKLHSFRNNLFHGKQRELVNKKECSKVIYLISKTSVNATFLNFGEDRTKYKFRGNLISRLA